MSDPNAYLMLISSLPQPTSLFGSKQTPLSRLKLDRRLRVLTPEDAENLALIENALQWYRLPIELSEEQAIDRGRLAMSKIENETLRLILRDRLELRTCMAALRRRHRGESAPSAETRWGYGRWVRHIAANWTEQGFGLDGVFPWIREADRLLKSNDTMGLERLILGQVWTNLSRRRGEHYFDFEAVVIYVLRWNVVYRWTVHDSDAAAERFEGLVQDGLGDFTEKFEQGEA